MGHYQRKPYKKHSIDPYNDIDIEREYLDALDEDDDIFEGPYGDEIIETHLINEPEIVRQLRQEELEGTLPIWLLDYPDEVTSTMTTSTPFENDMLPDNKIKHQKTYQKTLKIARKILKELPSENSESIQNK